MRHEEEGSNQVSTHGRDTIPPPHPQMEETAAWRGREVFKATTPKSSSQTLASESPRALIREQMLRPSQVRAGGSESLDAGVGSGPGPCPSDALLPPGLPKPSVWGLNSLASLTTAIPSFACPPGARISRSRVCPSVCQPIPSAGQYHGVHTGTVLVAAQIVSESRSWMSLALSLEFSAQTGTPGAQRLPPDCSPVAQVPTPGQNEPVQLCSVSLRGWEPLGPASPRPQP